LPSGRVAGFGRLAGQLCRIELTRHLPADWLPFARKHANGYQISCGRPLVLVRADTLLATCAGCLFDCFSV
jgi:hypothetical protein